METMWSIDVANLDLPHRQALEDVIGMRLLASQQANGQQTLFGGRPPRQIDLS